MIGDGNEIPLSDGNTKIVRIGDTVRRAITKQSPIIHRFLKHLETQGFQHSPYIRIS